MMTILGSIIGFLGSAVPEVFKLIREKDDRVHELAVLDRQIEQQKLGQEQRLEEIRTQADIAESQALYNFANRPSGVSWVDALQSSVRPVLTYAFFGVFAAVKLTLLMSLVHRQGLLVTDAIAAMWDEETQALFAAVMAFWFGARSLQKLRSTG